MDLEFLKKNLEGFHPDERGLCATCRWPGSCLRQLHAGANLGCESSLAQPNCQAWARSALSRHPDERDCSVSTIYDEARQKFDSLVSIPTSGIVLFLRYTTRSARSLIRWFPSRRAGVFCFYQLFAEELERRQ